MIIMSLRDIYDHLQVRWKSWWAESYPSAVPFPELPETQGRDALLIQMEEVRAAQVRDSAAKARINSGPHEGSQRGATEGRSADATVDRATSSGMVGEFTGQQ